MKTITLILSLLFSVSAMCMNRQEAEQLLAARRVSLQQSERSGHRLLLGEVTGAGRTVKLNRIQVLLVNDQAILRSEIESMDLIGNKDSLSEISSFRAHGIYFTSEDIKGALVKP